MHQLTRYSWLKTGLPPTAVNSLAKVNGRQTRRTLTLLIITSGKLCLNTTRHFIASQRTHGLKKVLQLIWDQRPAATQDSRQQGHTELHKNMPSLCKKKYQRDIFEPPGIRYYCVILLLCVMFSVLMVFIKQRSFFIILPILNHVKRLKPLKQKTTY